MFSFFSGCSQQPDFDKEITHDMVLRDDYHVNEVAKSSSMLSSPCGIICRENDILVCDEAANNIAILDLDGNYLDKIGTLGNAPLEFVRPTGIAQTEKYIYVIDSGNERIQVLDHDFIFVREIPLPHSQASNEYYFIDIAVTTDDCIYLSTNFLDASKSRIFTVSSDEEVTEVSSQSFFGFLTAVDNEVYGTNTLVHYETKDSQAARSGESKLRNITMGKDISDLPYKYTPSDFVYFGNNYYCLSGLCASLDRLDENGVYLDTLMILPSFPSVYTYLDVSRDGAFYVTDRETGLIYIVRKEE